MEQQSRSPSRNIVPTSSRRLVVDAFVLKSHAAQQVSATRLVAGSATTLVHALVSSDSVSIHESATTDPSKRDRPPHIKSSPSKSLFGPTTADLPPPSNAKAAPSLQSSLVELDEMEANLDLIAFEYALRIVSLMVREDREKCEYKLQRAFSVSSSSLRDIKARVISTNTSDFYDELYAHRSKYIEQHPVYTRTAFLTDKGRSVWQQQEKQRLLDAKKTLSTSKFVFSPPVNDLHARLWIRISEGRDLPSRSESGGVLNRVANATVLAGRAMHEPYVVVKFGRQKERTDPIRDSMNPTWNTDFCLDIADNTSENILISLRHQIAGYPDATVGQITLNIEEISRETSKDAWFPLQKPTKPTKRRSSSSSRSESPQTASPPNRGEIKISYCYVPLRGANTRLPAAEENFNRIYRHLFQRLLVNDNSTEIRRFAHQLRRVKQKPNRLLRDEEDDDVDSLSAAIEVTSNQPRSADTQQAASFELVELSSAFQLGETSLQILKSFSSIFLVRQQFCDLCLLEVLAKCNDFTSILHQILRLMQIYIPQANDIFSETELALFEKIKRSYAAFIGSALSQFTERFQCDPTQKPSKSAFSNAIKLFVLLHIGDSEISLRSKIKTSCDHAYATAKASSKAKATSLGLAPVQAELNILLNLIDFAIDFVDNFETIFAPEFPPKTNATLTAVSKLVELILSDLVAFCSTFDQRATAKDTYELTFLLQRIVYLNQNWVHILPNVHDKLDFAPFVHQRVVSWIEDMDSNLLKWTVNSQLVDDYRPIGKEILHSVSVVDLFSAFGLAYDFLGPLLAHLPSSSVFGVYAQFSQSIARNAEKFCERIRRDVSGSLTTNVDKSSSPSSSFDPVIRMLGGLFSPSPISAIAADHSSFRPTEAICVKLNNQEACRVMLNEMATQIGIAATRSHANGMQTEPKLVAEDVSRHLFSESLSGIKQGIEGQIDQICSNLSVFLEPKLLNIIALARDDKGRIVNLLVPRTFHAAHPGLNSKPLSEQLEPLFDYLNEILQEVSDLLYQSLFKRLLKKLSHPQLSILTTEQLDLISDILNLFKHFLSADGAGIPIAHLDRDIESTVGLLKMHKMSTEQLVLCFTQPSQDYANPEKRRCVLRILEIRGATGDRLAANCIQNLPRQTWV